ncbi:RluA family pseudouridine synthase [Temperatibacter marinus]|uniref:Pseudouridine synthase n=1 Tax=Temperatibacter marinus TaxID=1456591 RepID=A0AA52EG91_9PROT|nr:RluA family pseudouridine synthase [Temperatibacter marinus]WND03118.1 RluA family pseudouridine synthase [Temperatibacter marinus]
MTDQITILIPSDLKGQRLDKVISDLVPDISRSRLKSLIKDGQVAFSNGRRVKSPSQKVHDGDKYILSVPEAEDPLPLAEDIPLDIVYEDADLIVVNKPAGMVVHPAPGSPKSTLVNALLHHCAGSLSGIGGVKRPGIVHRIDKETSGLLVMAKHDKAHNGLAKQFADHSIDRLYSAFCRGEPKELNARIEGNIGRHPGDRKKMAVVSELDGRWAATHFRALDYYMSGNKTVATHIECKLETGRTHQVRVHMNNIGHPLIGDPVYGNLGKFPSTTGQMVRSALMGFKRQALHARSLGFIHPISGAPLKFETELPSDMKDLIDALSSHGKVFPADSKPFDQS